MMRPTRKIFHLDSEAVLTSTNKYKQTPTHGLAFRLHEVADAALLLASATFALKTCRGVETTDIRLSTDCCCRGFGAEGASPLVVSVSGQISFLSSMIKQWGHMG